MTSIVQETQLLTLGLTVDTILQDAFDLVDLSVVASLFLCTVQPLTCECACFTMQILTYRDTADLAEIDLSTYVKSVAIVELSSKNQQENQP